MTTGRVHVLIGGRTLCNAPDLRCVPRRWPDGHRWVHVADAEFATCPGCIRELALRRRHGIG